MSYTLKGLIDVNPSYHHEHRVTESDVVKANNIVQVIESTRRNDMPQPGDIVQYTTKHGDYYAKAHIENAEDGKLSICEQPYIPFVTVRNGVVRTNTSGGAWESIPANLERVGKAPKVFKDWGHCGACGNGAFNVVAQVNVWRYTEGNPEFTTEHYNMFYATRLAEPDQWRNLWIVREGYSTPYKAFCTDAEYLRWLEQVKGKERPAAWPNSKLVWVKKEA